MKQVFEYDLSEPEIKFEETDDLYQAREDKVKAERALYKIDSEVTIYIVGYNRLEKTKRCVESVLKYTSDVNYDLILVDNGSDDGTFEYFKSINHDKTTVIRFNKNYGYKFLFEFLEVRKFSDFCVSLANDIVVTKNWLSNMLKVAKSDNRIGMVNPMSSNVSNNQAYNPKFMDYDEMQKIAAEFNVSDPTKWQERLRLITLGTLYTKECLYAMGWPLSDCGFIHDFGDDDITFRVRRAGYKAVLAGDTWVHHDHKLEDKDPVDFQYSIETGKKNFRDKYYGIDAWDDVNNYVYPFIGEHISMPADIESVKILGIDVKCGTPVLDIKNIIRKYGIFTPELSAFTRDSKYHLDLKTICDGQVVCDRIEHLYNSFENSSFDYIIIDQCINKYAEPVSLLKNAFSLLKSGGQLFFKLKNTYNIFTQLELLGYNVSYNESVIHCKPETIYDTLLNSGIKAELINRELFNVNKEINDFASQIINLAKQKDSNGNLLLSKLMTDNYWFKIMK